MENINLIDTFAEFKELKNIDRVTMMSVLEEVFRSVLIRQYGTDENFDVIINIDKGDFEIWRRREVVADEDLEDPYLQISLTDAHKITKKTFSTLEDFYSKAALIDKEFILDEADYTYRLYSSIITGKLAKPSFESKFNEEIVYRRLYAFNWLLNSDQNWDDVKLDT